MATALRVTTNEARRAFNTGARILVSEHGHEPTYPVGPLTQTHDKTTTSFVALSALVEAWRNRYPYQRYYVVQPDTD